MLPSPYNHIGIACKYKGDYERAIQYHQKALRIQGKWGEPLASQVTRTTETLLEAARTELIARKREL